MKAERDTERIEIWKKLYSDGNGTKTVWHLINVAFIESYSIEFAGIGSAELYLTKPDHSSKVFLASGSTTWEANDLRQLLYVPRKGQLQLLHVRGDVQVFIKLHALAHRKAKNVGDAESCQDWLELVKSMGRRYSGSDRMTWPRLIAMFWLVCPIVPVIALMGPPLIGIPLAIFLYFGGYKWIMSKEKPNPLDKIYVGPRGGMYRINSSGRKSYDV